MILELPFPHIDPIAIRLGPLAIRWYALMYLAAFAIGYWLMLRRLRHEPYKSITKPSRWARSDVEDVLFAAIFGLIVGARLGFVLFYEPAPVLRDPLSVFAVWRGGMSFHGGAIGVMVALVVLAKRRGRPWLQLTDLLAPAVPIGLAAGRLGNFVNGELWGRPAPEWLPWAMRFPSGGDVLRHPSQLYQALGEGLALAALLWWYARKPRRRGQVSGAFLFGYGVLRFGVEFFRQPDVQLGYLGFGLTMGQWLCVPMILAGAWLWEWSRRRGIIDVEEDAGDSADVAADGEDYRDAEDVADAEAEVDAGADDLGGSSDADEAEAAEVVDGPEVEDEADVSGRSSGWRDVRVDDNLDLTEPMPRRRRPSDRPGGSA